MLSFRAKAEKEIKALGVETLAVPADPEDFGYTEDKMGVGDCLDYFFT